MVMPSPSLSRPIRTRLTPALSACPVGPHIAEDIVQEAFVRVLKDLDRFDSRFRFGT
jgi:DNA-directed RNA polymerase specialized sigma24 family protein